MILPLGRWALRTALAQRAGHWPERIGLSVNISPLQFHQPSFLAEVDAALAETGFPRRAAGARDHRDRADARQSRDRPTSSAR